MHHAILECFHAGSAACHAKDVHEEAGGLHAVAISVESFDGKLGGLTMVASRGPSAWYVTVSSGENERLRGGVALEA